MTDSYGKLANLTPALLWSNTAIRLQKKERRNRVPATLSSKINMLDSLRKKKKCLYLAGVLLNPMSSQDTLVLRSVILSETVSQWTQTKPKVESRGIWRRTVQRSNVVSAFLGQEPFLSLASISLKITAKHLACDRHLPPTEVLSFDYCTPFLNVFSFHRSLSPQNFKNNTRYLQSVQCSAPTVCTHLKYQHAAKLLHKNNQIH